MEDSTPACLLQTMSFTSLSADGDAIKVICNSCGSCLDKQMCWVKSYHVTPSSLLFSINFSRDFQFPWSLCGWLPQGLHLKKRRRGPEGPESIDPRSPNSDVAGTLPIYGWRTSVLLPVGDTVERLGTGSSTWNIAETERTGNRTEVSGVE